MKIVFYSLILNYHQANVADELWELTNHQYCFVELRNMGEDHKKGDSRDYSDCPYLLRAWESEDNKEKAMELSRKADCCVFSGVEALPYQKERMKLGLLSFDMSERWLKKGLKNILSPAISRMLLAYWTGKWNKKNIYKLCSSAYASYDHKRLHMYKGKCYKWGYFTKVNDDIESKSIFNPGYLNIMWCSRYLKLKHPELPVLLAQKLKNDGYSFNLSMYGEGDLKPEIVELAKKLAVNDVISFIDNKPNVTLMRDMRNFDIFLFTSDRNEGWGAVANESMSNGCILVASKEIGSAPYLINEGITGFSFKSPSVKSGVKNPDYSSLEDLYSKVTYLINHPIERINIQQNAVCLMRNIWSPRNAAESLLRLVEDLRKGKLSSIEHGPCSPCI